MNMNASVRSTLRWGRIRNSANTLLITGFTTVVLAVFLMPFLYMLLTSVKTNEQMTFNSSPIWPAKVPKIVYAGENTGVYTVKVRITVTGDLVDRTIDLSKFAGQELEIYTVKLEDGTSNCSGMGICGTKKNLALIQGFKAGSIFIDPKNPAADPIVWNGGTFKSLPRPWIFSPTWGNYKDMWNSIDYPRVMWNTAYYAFTTTVGVLISCILVAYGFSRFRFPGRDILFVILISILFLPGTVTVIPTFTFFTKIKWVGTWAPLIIPSFFANPYDTFLLRQYFMTLPRELDEAAMMDGASPLRILWSVIIPQSYPVVIAVTVFHIVWAWNDYFGPLIYLSTKMKMQPVSVALARFNGMYGSHPELIQAGALLTLIIPLVLFFLAQRFFVQGIVITGVER
jgi:multiple sugar transport system permease protein